ncbi:RNA 2',3'-cyclic phosphodiesterase [uncultured Desulfobacter sp.]|uniref:RNA 2',3'-cyclic phosphodiesterase n=1 Tax=uncultured Desulfobacter sp. TaxID=240139 RepID=UPI002AA67F8F|nr:RNA 2',3'-cyclic phosphodiesterase [uncultured Desulfobacter sp.]
MNLKRNIDTGRLIRCFIAITIDDHTKRRLCQVQKAIRATGIHAGWPPSKNFHLTLKFLGDIPEQTLPCIKTVLSEAIAQSHCFNIKFNRIGFFPNARHPKTIWIGPDKASPELITLKQTIDAKLKRCHQCTKEKNFSPHITLSRIRHKVSPSKLQKIFNLKTGAITYSVEQVHLIKSRLSPSGAVHTSIFQANMNAS